MSKRVTTKWLRRLFVALALLTAGVWLGGGCLVRSWIAKPPALPSDLSVMRLLPEQRDGKIWLGKCWAGHRERLPVVYLKGSPFEMGYAEGVLQKDQMHTLEDEFIKMVRGYVPKDWVLQMLKDYVLYRNRHLSANVPLDYRLEIYGTSLGCPDMHPEIGPYYNRLLNYHAAHDVSYMMIDNPFVTHAGCTAFGVWGGETSHGHLIAGRNFDWEAAEVFSRDRVVMMFEPDGGIPFISLAWAGMAGVVSGMNRAGVSVTINGAPSNLPKETATPVAIVAREVLERAHNLAEALEIMRQSKVFVSTIWLVGSRADGRFVTVEKTPDVMQVREPEGDWIVCANHFKTPGLSETPRNEAYRVEATSVSREERLTELIKQASGPIDEKQAAVLLRDRKLPGGVFAGDGNRASLNAFIATHAVIMDLTDGIFWAASPPNQLGKFVAFDVQNFSHELPERTIEADLVLASGEYEKTRQAQWCLAEGGRALDKHQPEIALDAAVKAESLNPGFYQDSMLKGRALFALRRRAEAASAFSDALAEHPAFQKEKLELDGLLQQAQKKD